MPAERIQNQLIKLSDGRKVTGKTVRRASRYLVADLTIAKYPEVVFGNGTYGTAKVDGLEIPVIRGRGRGGPWKQVGDGRRNDA